jgi:hypothetical protein
MGVSLRLWQSLHNESACGSCYRPSQSLIGRKFGRLTVLAFHHKNRDIFWKTVCECGTQCIHPTGPMKNGHVRSCGCLQVENRKQGLTGEQSALRKAIHNYKANAEGRGLAWTISERDAFALFTADCVGCGAKPTRKVRSNTGEIACNGIDRIDNDGSYTSTNVQTLCKTCNFAKAQLSQGDFEAYLNSIRLNSLVKPFYLLRTEDVNGNSGTGVVAVGAIMPSNRCILEWTTNELTETIFESLEQIERLHGHNGRTTIIMGAPPIGYKR